jgi:hypothetical protein
MSWQDLKHECKTDDPLNLRTTKPSAPSQRVFVVYLMNLQHPAERVDELVGTIFQYASQYGEKAQDAVRQVRPLAERSMKEQPMVTLAGAAAIGFLLGVLWQEGQRTAEAPLRSQSTQPPKAGSLLDGS